MKKASLADASGPKPGAVSRESGSAQIMPAPVSRSEAVSIQKNTQEKKRQASGSSSRKRAARSGMMVMDMKPPARR